MPFIGNRPALSYIGFAKQDFTTSATTTYTLDYPVANENEIELFINNVRQEPTTAYTASGTTLTLTTATTVSDDMYAVFQGKAVQTITPPASSITNSMVASGAAIAYSKLNLSGSIVNADVNSSAAIAYSKLNLNSSIALTDLSATGTKNSTTFLRGDNTFAAAGKLLQVVSATDSTARTTTSTSFVTASNTLSVTLTPASTSSKVFVIATGAIYIAGGSTYTKATIYRDATNLGSADGMSNTYDGSNDNSSGMSLSILDSPNTTSATTYQVYILTNNASNTAYLNVNGAKGSITAFEIAG